MKKVLLLFFLLLTFSLFSQEISIPNDVLKLPGNELSFYVKNYDNKNGLLLQFGDEQEVFISKGVNTEITPSKHIYETEGKYVVKLYDVANVEKMIAAANVEIIGAPKRIVIESFIVTKYHPVKEGGSAWDNRFSGTYPDMYVSVFADGKEIAEQKYYRRDVSQESLPFEVLKEPLIVKLPDSYEVLSFIIYDHDSVTDHDNMGGFVLSNINMLLSNADGLKKTFEGDLINIEFVMSVE